MNLNNLTAVEERDGNTRATKKYISKDGKVIYGPFQFSDGQDGESCSDEELDQYLAELDEYKRQNPPELPTLEEMIKSSERYYSQIRMWDYGLGKMSNEQAIADFYGGAIVRKIKEDIEYSYNHNLPDQKPGQISKKLWQRMKDIRAGKRPKEKQKYTDQCKHLRQQKEPHCTTKSEPTEIEPKPEKKEKPKIEVKKRERQKGDDYFLPTERGIIRNETYRKLFKGPSVVYEWLWANIVRSQWRDSKAYPIKEKFYDKGYLAFCSTYGKIAKECGMSKNTVHAYIKSFEKAGIIKTKLYVPDGKTQGQTVFILGTWTMVKGERVELYYRDSVFVTPKPVKN